MSAKTKTRRRGFTLIEVMAAGTIFLVVFVGVIGSYAEVERMNAHLRHQTTGLYIAQASMEELILLSPQSPLLAAGLSTRQVDDEGQADSNGLYSLQWEVTPNTPIAGMRRVDVTVRWSEASGDRSVNLFTYRN